MNEIYDIIESSIIISYQTLVHISVSVHQQRESKMRLYYNTLNTGLYLYMQRQSLNQCTTIPKKPVLLINIQKVIIELHH